MNVASQHLNSACEFLIHLNLVLEKFLEGRYTRTQSYNSYLA